MFRQSYHDWGQGGWYAIHDDTQEPIYYQSSLAATMPATTSFWSPPFNASPVQGLFHLTASGNSSEKTRATV